MCKIKFYFINITLIQGDPEEGSRNAGNVELVPQRTMQGSPSMVGQKLPSGKNGKNTKKGGLGVSAGKDLGSRALQKIPTWRYPKMNFENIDF